MKITFITTQQAYWGGSEELWIRIVALSILKGHAVQVVVYGQHGGLHPSLQKLKQTAASFVELRNTVKAKSLIRKVLNALQLKLMPDTLRQVDKFGPDCILVSQANNFDAAFYQIVNHFLLQYDKPFFLISQFNIEHGGLSYDDIQKARVIFGKARNIFFVSKRNKEVSERQLAKTIENAIFIDNPLNLADTAYVDYPESNEKVHFASVARLEVDFKGQDILLQLLSRPKWKKREWHLNIYGKGPDERYLKELCCFYELKNKVTFHGQIADIREVWKYNHALLLPSIAEGKPLALEEAMICGRIGIATDVAGNTELIDDLINGFIASSYFPYPYEEALEKAWSERDNWEAMGRKAHEKMLNTLDLAPHETLLNVMEQIYLQPLPYA